jgi:hypothetical protein
VTKLLTRRRASSSVVGSLVLHGLVVITWPRHVPAPPPAAPAREISIEPVSRPPPPSLAISLVGPRPSGRGRARAGSDPLHAGSPRRADLPRAARGRALGAGAEGAGSAEVEPVATSAATDVPPGPLAAADAIPIPAPVFAEKRGPIPLPAAAVPAVDAEQTFERLVRAQMMMLAKGQGGGLAGPGAGGAGTGVGLSTALSGRQVVDSPVTTAPVVVEARPVECELPSSLHLSATVHVLVTREGAPAVPRLLRPSGQDSFDACAMSYVLAMRFSPGLDAHARPLDVWMNVRVAPVTATQVGAAP